MRCVQEVAYKVLALKLDEAEIREIRGLFDRIDAEGRGYVYKRDLQQLLAEKSPVIARKEGDRYDLRVLASKVLQRERMERVESAGGFTEGGGAADVRPKEARGHKGTMAAVITFDMFVMAAIEEDDELVQRHLVKVFEAIDVDGSGTVSRSARRYTRYTRHDRYSRYARS